jgi:hypothetical protein
MGFNKDLADSCIDWCEFYTVLFLNDTFVQRFLPLSGNVFLMQPCQLLGMQPVHLNPGSQRNPDALADF